MAIAKHKIILASDRENFENVTKIASSTQYASIDVNGARGRQLKSSPFLISLGAKRLLLMIHGFNTKYNDAIETYVRVHTHFYSRYETFIGYLWPSESVYNVAPDEHYRVGFIKNYGNASDKVTNSHLKFKLARLIGQLSRNGQYVDILAHSLGCKLTLEALQHVANHAPRNVYFVGGALEKSALMSPSGKYYSVRSKVQAIHSFSSKKDGVLKGFYSIGEGETTENITQATHAKRQENMSWFRDPETSHTERMRELKNQFAPRDPIGGSGAELQDGNLYLYDVTREVNAHDYDLYINSKCVRKVVMS